MPPKTTSRLVRTLSILVVTNLITQIAIIVTGGAVRLTDSGLGCSTWPNCEPGEFTPAFHSATSIHPYVEWGNRVFGVIVVAVAVALAVTVWRATRRGLVTRQYRGRGLWPMMLSIGQAVLGGMTVRFDLHPALVGSHFLISAVLVWISAWLIVGWFRPEAGSRIVPAPVHTLGWALAAVAGAVVVLGMIVTGAGPHSGDSDVGYRFAVDPLLFSRLHSGTVWLFVALLAAFIIAAYRIADGGPHLHRLRRLTLVVAAVTVVQGGIGYLQYYTGLPEVLVGLHMLGAAVLIATTAFLVSALTARERD